jgi:hypothetical protein
MSTRDYDRKNAESRGRLLAFVELARSAQSSVDAPSAVAGLLAHLAFWDRLTLLRWEQALASGELTPAALDTRMTDFINDAALPQWRRSPFEEAARDALDAADRVDRFIESLDPAVAEALIGEGRERLIDRSLHRMEHLEEINRSGRG